MSFNNDSNYNYVDDNIRELANVGIETYTKLIKEYSEKLEQALSKGNTDVNLTSDEVIKLVGSINNMKEVVKEGSFYLNK